MFPLAAINKIGFIILSLEDFIEIPGIASSIAIYASPSLNRCLGIVAKPGNKGHDHFGEGIFV